MGLVNSFDLNDSYEQYQKIVDLPPAAKFILYILDAKKILTRKGIEQETLLPKRTIGASIQILIKQNIIEKIPYEELLKMDMFYRKRIDNRETYYRVK